MESALVSWSEPGSNGVMRCFRLDRMPLKGAVAQHVAQQIPASGKVSIAIVERRDDADKKVIEEVATAEDQIHGAIDGEVYTASTITLLG